MDVGERDISGTMCIGGADNEEPEIYAHFSSPLDDEGALAVTFVSPREDVPEFVLHGSAFELQAGTNFARTLILTDGTTVVGFAKHQPV
ncbi:MAG: hypothetical protein ABIT83_04525 [Massilia sp.]